MTEIATINAGLTTQNEAALARVAERLPQLVDQTRVFDRANSQSTLTMMSLTMLNGQSPMRLLRQALAEIEQRRMALSESQVRHAELQEELDALSKTPPSLVRDAKMRHNAVSLAALESKINGAVKDIAYLADAYDAIEKKYGVTGWGEAEFEAAEKAHHVRRAFELLYRNLISVGRASEATIEYMQQYGVHVQIALAEVSGYITHTEQRIAKGERMTGADIERFLDQMRDKYVACADEAAERIFGAAEIANTDYMIAFSEEKTND